MPAETYDQVVVKIDADGGYLIECEEPRVQTLYQADNVLVNGTSLAIESKATFDGELSVEYRPTDSAVDIQV